MTDYVCNVLIGQKRSPLRLRKGVGGGGRGGDMYMQGHPGLTTDNLSH